MDDQNLEHLIELTSTSPLPDQPEGMAASQQLKQLLEKFVDNLPEQFRSVFMLRAVENASVKETAEILEIPQATVKTRFFRARRLMHKQLNAHFDAEGLSIHEFAGARCNYIVKSVMQRISSARLI